MALIALKCDAENKTRGNFTVLITIKSTGRASYLGVEQNRYRGSFRASLPQPLAFSNHLFPVKLLVISVS